MHRPLLYRLQYLKKLWGNLKKVWQIKMFSLKSMTKLEDLTVHLSLLGSMLVKQDLFKSFTKWTMSQDFWLSFYFINHLTPQASNNSCIVILMFAKNSRHHHTRCPNFETQFSRKQAQNWVYKFEHRWTAGVVDTGNKFGSHGRRNY